MRMLRKVLLLTVLALSASTIAHAEPFTVLPNGDLVFNVSLATTGTFSCGSVVSCTGSGTNSITLHSGSGTATLTFTGVSTSIALGNMAVPLTVGTFEGSTTQGFELFEPLNQYVPLLYLDFTISHSSPVVASRSLRWGFGPTFTRVGEEGITYLALPVGDQPPQYHYTSIVYSFRVFPLTLPLNGSQALVADVGAVPEPASVVLVGSGLIGAILRRRKRARGQRIPS